VLQCHRCTATTTRCHPPFPACAPVAHRVCSQALATGTIHETRYEIHLMLVSAAEHHSSAPRVAALTSQPCSHTIMRGREHETRYLSNFA